MGASKQETVMHGKFDIDPNMSIDNVMRLWPQTIPIILGYGMHCVGCPLAPFYSAADAAKEHSIEVDDFLTALGRAIPGAKE